MRSIKGSYITPMIGSPLYVRARAKTEIGTPCEKGIVPSKGSHTHVISCPKLWLSSSPSTLWSGKRAFIFSITKALIFVSAIVTGVRSDFHSRDVPATKVDFIISPASRANSFAKSRYLSNSFILETPFYRDQLKLLDRRSYLGVGFFLRLASQCSGRSLGRSPRFCNAALAQN